MSTKRTLGRSLAAIVHRCQRPLWATLLLLLAADFSIASVILAVVTNPIVTAGGGATSTRSGAGTFHIYAFDYGVDTYGISSYSLAMGPAVTASNNRSPVSTIMDSNGDNQSAGFNLLRSPSNASVMTGAQNLPDQTPFSIKGIGQNIGSINAIAAAQPGSSVVGPTTSGAWGGPYASLPNFYQPIAGKYWVFLGEGTYSGTSHDPQSIVSSATFTVYGYPDDFRSIATRVLPFTDPLPPPDPPRIPEPTTIVLLTIGLATTFGVTRRR